MTRNGENFWVQPDSDAERAHKQNFVYQADKTTPFDDVALFSWVMTTLMKDGSATWTWGKNSGPFAILEWMKDHPHRVVDYHPDHPHNHIRRGPVVRREKHDVYPLFHTHDPSH